MLKSSGRSDDGLCNANRSDDHKSIVKLTLFTGNRAGNGTISFFVKYILAITFGICYNVYVNIHVCMFNNQYDRISRKAG